MRPQLCHSAKPSARTAENPAETLAKSRADFLNNLPEEGQVESAREIIRELLKEIKIRDRKLLIAMQTVRLLSCDKGAMQ